jgi:N-acetylneuraminic acid mutarotase
VRRFAATLILCAACGDAAAGDDPPAADAAIGPDAAPSPWQALRPLPAARQETAVVELRGEVVVIGGFDGQGQPVATVEAYDPVSDGWRALKSLPAARHHANAAVVGERLYVLGSNEGLTFTPRGDVWIYDPDANEWTSGAPMPSPRGSSAVGAIGTTIYVAGGLAGGAVATLSAYDTVANEWITDLPPLPQAKDHLVGAAVDGVFYAIGGRNGTITGLIGTVDAFDPATKKWTPRKSMPTPRGGAAAGVLDGRVLVAGGEGNAQLASGVFDAHEAYDPASDEWTTLPPMRTPRHGTGAAVVGGRLVVPGGATQQGFGAVATVEAFAP